MCIRDRLKAGLEKIGEKHSQVQEIHGLGLMVSVEFTDADGEPDGATAAAVHKAAAENGLLLLTNGMYGHHVRFIPALVVTEGQIDDALAVWEKTLDETLG